MTPRCPRFESLDIWRGIACLMVTIYHIAGDKRFVVEFPQWVTKVLSFGWLGVPMFFVISGYCIAATCDSHRARKRGWRVFFLRRFRRIFPPYWACLVLIGILTVAGWMNEHMLFESQRTPLHIFGNISLTEIWLAPLMGQHMALILMPAWTLMYEEQFYAVSGIIVALKPDRFFGWLAITSMFVIALSALNWFGTIHFHGFFFDGLWLQFWMGTLIYYIRNYLETNRTSFVIGCIFATFCLICMLRVLIPPAIIDELSRTRFFDGTAFAILFSLLLLAGSEIDQKVANLKVMLPFAACGWMCYSLYLTHLPVISLMRKYFYHSGSGALDMHWLEAILTLGVTLMVGGVFYWFIERHFLNQPSTAPSASRSRAVQNPNQSSEGVGT